MLDCEGRTLLTNDGCTLFFSLIVTTRARNDDEGVSVEGVSDEDDGGDDGDGDDDDDEEDDEVVDVEKKGITG